MHVLLSHVGKEKVTKYITDNYDINNIKESVEDTIIKCEACHRTKVATTKTKEETIKRTATGSC